VDHLEDGMKETYKNKLNSVIFISQWYSPKQF